MAEDVGKFLLGMLVETARNKAADHLEKGTAIERSLAGFARTDMVNIINNLQAKSAANISTALQHLKNACDGLSDESSDERKNHAESELKACHQCSLKAFNDNSLSPEEKIKAAKINVLANLFMHKLKNKPEDFGAISNALVMFSEVCKLPQVKAIFTRNKLLVQADNMLRQEVRKIFLGIRMYHVTCGTGSLSSIDAGCKQVDFCSRVRLTESESCLCFAAPEFVTMIDNVSNFTVDSNGCLFTEASGNVRSHWQLGSDVTDEIQALSILQEYQQDHLKNGKYTGIESILSGENTADHFIALARTSLQRVHLLSLHSNCPARCDSLHKFGEEKQVCVMCRLGEEELVIAKGSQMFIYNLVQRMMTEQREVAGCVFAGCCSNGNTIYLTDSANKQVLILTTADKNIIKVNSVGQTKFSHPQGLAYDPVTSHVLICDAGLKKILIASRCAEHLEYRGHIQVPDAARAYTPRDIQVTPSGTLLVQCQGKDSQVLWVSEIPEALFSWRTGYTNEML